MSDIGDIFANPTTPDDHDHRNIVIFGDVGTGKSALINLICGRPLALTSSLRNVCTLRPERYVATLDNVTLTLHDTRGLHEAQGRMDRREYLDAVHQAYALISRLERSGGISLLVFCMKGGRVSITMQQTYNLFVEVLCNRQVPVVIVVTHLEMYDDMEQWWSENERSIREHGLRSHGHACITATRGYQGIFSDKYEQSEGIIRKLLLDHSRQDRKEEKPSWIKREVLNMRNWISPGRVKQTDYSDLRKKLTKRCGFSLEDAELVARMIEQSQGMSEDAPEDKPRFGDEFESSGSGSGIPLPIVSYVLGEDNWVSIAGSGPVLQPTNRGRDRNDDLVHVGIAVTSPPRSTTSKAEDRDITSLEKEQSAASDSPQRVTCSEDGDRDLADGPTSTSGQPQPTTDNKDRLEDDDPLSDQTTTSGPHKSTTHNVGMNNDPFDSPPPATSANSGDIEMPDHCSQLPGPITPHNVHSQERTNKHQASHALDQSSTRPDSLSESGVDAANEGPPRLVETRHSKHTNSSLDYLVANAFQNDLTHQISRDGYDPVASGGFADIYRGVFEKNGGSTKVAIKAVKMYLEDDDLSKKQKRLRREIKVWLDLRHANVVPLLGTTMGFGRFPAMVCPWAEKGTLTSYLEKHYDGLSVVEVLGLVDNVASGLQYLHSCSVVHGDLSGSNILICENGIACIADFGLSMLLSEIGAPTFVTSFRARGTLRWTAPELLDLEVPEDGMEDETLHSAPTTQSDVYSFGSIMLQILSGRVPYHYYIREGQVIHAIAKGNAPRRPNSGLVTERRWSFIQRCWSKTTGDVQARPLSEEIVGFTKEELADTRT